MHKLYSGFKVTQLINYMLNRCSLLTIEKKPHFSLLFHICILCKHMHTTFHICIICKHTHTTFHICILCKHTQDFHILQQNLCKTEPQQAQHSWVRAWDSSCRNYPIIVLWLGFLHLHPSTTAMKEHPSNNNAETSCWLIITPPYPLMMKRNIPNIK